ARSSKRSASPRRTDGSRRVSWKTRRRARRALGAARLGSTGRVRSTRDCPRTKTWGRKESTRDPEDRSGASARAAGARARGSRRSGGRSFPDRRFPIRRADWSDGGAHRFAVWSGSGVVSGPARLSPETPPALLRVHPATSGSIHGWARAGTSQSRDDFVAVGASVLRIAPRRKEGRVQKSVRIKI